MMGKTYLNGATQVHLGLRGEGGCWDSILPISPPLKPKGDGRRTCHEPAIKTAISSRPQRTGTENAAC